VIQSINYSKPLLKNRISPNPLWTFTTFLPMPH
jgi:hypothetical protein